MSERKNEGCVGIILRIFGVEGPVPPPTFGYGLREAFLSPAELSFFHVLKDALGPGRHLIAKVRLADLFSVKTRKSGRAAFNRIAMKHVDFLVCDAETMRPLLGVELDDASHRAEKAKARDLFVEELFAKAELPLLRVAAAGSYVPEEIAALVSAKLGATSGR